MTGPGPSGDQPSRPWRPTISAVLTLGFGTLVLVAVGAVMWVSLGVARENTFDLLRSTAELTVDSVIGRVERHIGAAQHQVEYLAALLSSGELDSADADRLEEILLGSLAAAPQVSEIAFIGADFGTVRVARHNGELRRLRANWRERPEARDWVAARRHDRTSSWDPVRWVEDLNTPSLVVHKTVRRGGEFLGIVGAVVSIGALSQFLYESDQAFDTHSFVLYGRDRVLAHPSLAGGTRGLSKDKVLPRLGEVNDRVLAAIWQESVDDMQDILAGSPVRGRVVTGPDDDYIYLYQAVEGFGPKPWYVGVHFLAADIGAPYRRLWLAVVIAVAILIAAPLLAVVLGRGIARPIKRLAEASMAIRSFELDKVKPLGSSPFRELDSAAEAYDSMVGGLRSFETYVPKSLVLRLMRLGETATRSEEREVSVLFTDIAGFTHLSSRYTPAELADFLNAHFALLGAAIDAENGTVDKYIGDSVMAFWGAPSDQPAHASQACRAALAIAEAIATDNRRRRAAGEESLGLRIGVHSGPAIVGNIGAPGRVNYTLIGDTVNTAQRLEALGKEFSADRPDTVILLSGETAALLEPGFELQPVGEHRLRGRTSKTGVFRLNGRVGPAGRSPGPQEGSAGP